MCVCLCVCECVCVCVNVCVCSFEVPNQCNEMRNRTLTNRKTHTHTHPPHPLSTTLSVDYGIQRKRHCGDDRQGLRCHCSGSSPWRSGTNSVHRLSKIVSDGPKALHRPPWPRHRRSHCVCCVEPNNGTIRHSKQTQADRQTDTDTHLSLP